MRLGCELNDKPRRNRLTVRGGGEGGVEGHRLARQNVGHAEGLRPGDLVAVDRDDGGAGHAVGDQLPVDEGGELRIGGFGACRTTCANDGPND